MGSDSLELGISFLLDAHAVKLLSTYNSSIMISSQWVLTSI